MPPSADHRVTRPIKQGPGLKPTVLSHRIGFRHGHHSRDRLMVVAQQTAQHICGVPTKLWW